ncbi:MAG: hypothetical protein WBM13_12950 [Bacteroidia bacterium]
MTNKADKNAFFFLKTSIIVCSMLLMLKVAYSQVNQSANLIPNPSFEKSFNKRGGDISAATPWIGVGTVDYYLKPEKRDTSRYKGARTGTCYAGLRFQKEYKEYIYAPLIETLKEGKLYHFEMFVRILQFDNVTVTIKQLGACFSEEPFSETMEFYKESIVDSTNPNGIAGTLDWIRIKGNYRAQGGEKYVILGNFNIKMKDDFVKKNKNAVFEFEEGYYYVDDISLYDISDKDTLKKVGSQSIAFPKVFEAGQVIQIPTIQFENGGARILKNSHKTLNELAAVLNNNPFMEILLTVKMSNSSLAKARAKSIAEYLTAQGVVNPIKQKAIVINSTTPTDDCVTEMQILVP